MAKKQNKQNKNPGTLQQANKPVSAPRPPAKSGTTADANKGFMYHYADALLATGIALLTFLFLKTVLNDQLTNWDDLGYVITNPLIKDNSAEGIKRIFEFDLNNLYPVIQVG